MQFFWKSGYMLGKALSSIGADTYQDGMKSGFGSGMSKQAMGDTDFEVMIGESIAEWNSSMMDVMEHLQTGVNDMSNYEKMRVFSAMMADEDDFGIKGQRSQDFEAAKEYFEDNDFHVEWSDESPADSDWENNFTDTAQSDSSNYCRVSDNEGNWFVIELHGGVIMASSWN